MHRTMNSLAVLLIVGLVAVPAGAETLDEVIEKHIEARGGLEAWNQIQSLKTTGSYSAFSKVSPFTLHRERSSGPLSKYHMDHVLDDKQVTIGYDGDTAWWVNNWYQIPWAQLMAGQDLKVFWQELDFESPFFNYQDKGYQVELLEEGDLDGQKALRLQLTRPDQAVETWYLDPETYLEIGYDAEGSDFGFEMPQRAFFDDFREVDGVMIPHYVEKQWYTRLRIMEVDEVETNLEIADELFRMPLPGEMRALQTLAGEWHVKTEDRGSPQMPWQAGEDTRTIEARLGGALLEEAFSSNGIRVIRTLSFDRFKERYRVSQMASMTSHLDVLEGTYEDGKMTVTNVQTDTSWQGFGQTMHQRLSIFDITPEGFRTEGEQSADGGENWFVNSKATYTRKAP